MSSATRSGRPTTKRSRPLVWWIALLFMIGSACFALGSFPPFADYAPVSVVGVVFFVGSLFFTSAGYSQFVQSVNEPPNEPAAGHRKRLVGWQPGNVDWLASAVQLVGTLWFNLNTFNAMRIGFDTRQQNFRIWTPDFLGSICFLVASELAIWVVCRKAVCVRRGDTDWRIAVINMVGSIFFMASAVAAFVRPDTGDLVDASIANSGTFLGALCFFWAAWLLRGTVVAPDGDEAAGRADGTTRSG